MFLHLRYSNALSAEAKGFAVLDSLLAIIPLFTLIGLGYVARHTLLDVRMLPALNQFVYYFAVPALLFNAARKQSLDSLFNLPALAAFSLGVVLTGVLTYALSRWVFACRDAEGLVMRMLNTIFANYAYMGIPLTFGLLGEATHAATISIILAGNLLVIGGAQLLIEISRQSQFSWLQVWRILDKSLLRSPIFVSTVLGLIASGLQLPLPKVMNSTLEMLAPAAIPVALFCLGASLQFKRTQTSVAEIATLISVKLIAHPALTWLAFVLIGVSDVIWLKATLLLCALPTGALVHVIAMRYNAFEQSSSQLIVLSTLLSLLTVTLWASLLSF